MLCVNLLQIILVFLPVSEQLIMHSSVKKLFVRDNTKISSVNHLEKLTDLYCSYVSAIDQDGMSKLTNVIILRCGENITF